MAVPEALTRFPQSISGLLPGLRQERIGLWSSFPGPRLDSVGAVSYLVISDTLQNDLPQPVALLCRALPQLLHEPQERLQRSLEAQSTWYLVVLLGRPRYQRPDHVVRRQRHADLLADHLRRLAPQHVHAQDDLDRAQVEFRMPPSPPRGQTEFQVNLKLGLTPCPPASVTSRVRNPGAVIRYRNSRTMIDSGNFRYSSSLIHTGHRTGLKYSTT